ELLTLFDRVALVGYTATPFANIFISLDAGNHSLGEDLFPRSFIINLKAPSDYVGPDLVFGHGGDESIDLPERDALPMHIPVGDADEWMPDKHRKEHYPGPLPPTLREALRLFVLTCAARRARGDGNEHSSMLVHVTRFVNVQSRVADQIQDELDG